MKLYTNAMSPNAKRARICCNELGVNVNLVSLDFTKGEHRKPEYLAKNPMGKVPTLEDDDGFVLWESPAIMTYLAMKNPQKNMLPNDAKGRAEVTRWMFWNASHYEQAVFTYAFEKMFKAMMGGTPDQAKMDACQKDYERYAPILEKQLENKAWIVGDSMTIADIHVGVVTEMAVQAGLDMSKCPATKAWVGRLIERASWKTA